jgi:uncharacterized protein DUF4268
MPQVKLGEIVEIDVDDVWKDEAQDFTPWLANNLGLLAKAIGLELAFKQREVPVGPYRADIVAETAHEEPKVVVIENQLDATDHDHLGKIVTYASGLNARWVVWIATDFREEHRSALDWLNRTSAGRVGFFGVSIKCVRIGNSEPAVEFDVECRPNEFTELVGEAESGSLSDTKRLQFEFWTRLKAIAEDRKFPLRLHKPLPQLWTNLAIGKAGVWLTLTASVQNHEVTCCLSIGVEGAWTVVGHLASNRQEIEGKLGPLEWPDKSAGKKQLVIWQSKEIDVADRDEWPVAFDWLLDRSLAFRDVFQPLITKL